MSKRKRIITLGTWDGKPIEWIVASKHKFTFLVLKNNLFNRLYDRSSSNWKTSDIRNFLNGDFFNKAFSDDEKKAIINVYLNDAKTKDNVFLLSVDEFRSLDSETQAFDGNCWYATRTTVDATRVHDVEATDSVSSRSVGDTLCIRCAMYIREK